MKTRKVVYAGAPKIKHARGWRDARKLCPSCKT